MASQYRRRSLMLNTIAKVAQGNPTIITDSSSRRLQKLNIYGQSSQDGMPSVENPIPIISKEVSEIKVTNGADLSQTVTLTEPITLRGIPVASGGNVTIDGQQYISDVITEKDGVVGVEKNVINDLTLDGSNDETWSVLGNPLEDVIRFVFKVKSIKSYNGISKQLKFEANYNLNNEHFYFDGTNLIIFINKNRLSTQDTTGLKSWLQTNPLTFDYASPIPDFEPLPEEIQTQYKALKSYYPNTVIQTGCWNEVTYSAKRGG